MKIFGNYMLNRWLMVFILILISFLLFVPAGISAEEKSAKEFYKGAILKIVIPYNPGGTTDTAARVLTPFFQKYLGAKIVIQNMPGAGGYVGLRYIFSAKPDGLIVSLHNPPGAYLAELLGQKEATWKLENLTYIGRVLKGSGGIMMVGKKSSLNKLEDVLNAKREIQCATIDPTVGASMYMALAAEGAGINLKIIPGFPGGRACILAVLRGEIEMTINPPAGFLEEFKNGDLRALAISAGKEIAPAVRDLFSSVPRLIDYPAEEGKKRFLELSNYVMDMGFVMTGPPSVPDDRAQFLRNAFMRALSEPEVKNTLETRGDFFAPLSGKDYLEIMRKMKASMSDIGVKNMEHILFKKFY